MIAMTSEAWKHVQELVERALAVDASARCSWLDEVCKDDDVLRDEVESLIAAYAPAQNFLEAPLGQSLSEEFAEAFNNLEGGRIGPYRILREIGHGGMGTVYLAARTDDQYEKRVAIKVIRRGMDTDAIVRRFRRERQILAALDHPYIARLFEGGSTEDGRPYLVMEYIEGQPIDRYCDSRRLSLVQRLNLFGLVCSAVQHAHRNLIVHQDIKPANILVTADGTPKLLDFGIAKLLNPELAFITLDKTAASRLITPEYASPEQVRGEPITTATDVYALGVLLYELLSGHHPYVMRPRVLNELFRAVCEDEPEAPSAVVTQPCERRLMDGNTATISPERVSADRDSQPAALSRHLRGDLDNIVLKAISKEPERRYSSAEQLSDDIRRHLEQLPIRARKGTFAYRAEKFLRRHAMAAAVGVIVAIVLTVSVGAVGWQARVARIERMRAERRFNDVRKLANSYLFEFHDAIENLPGSTPARALLVSRALEYLDDLSHEAGGDLGLQRELAAAYQRIGNVQGQPAFANLGDSTGALKSYGKALAIRENLVRANPGSVEDRLALGEIYRLKGNLLASTGHGSEAFKCVRKALQIARELSSERPGDRAVAIQLAADDGALADLEAGMDAGTSGGDLNAAVKDEREALHIYEFQLTLAPGNGVLVRQAALSSMRLGDVLAKLGGTEAALASYREALSHFASDPANAPNAATRRDIANIWYRIGTVLIGQGHYHDALIAFQKGLSLSQSLADADPRNAQARADLAYGYADVGEAAVRDGKVAGGLSQMRQGIRMMEEIMSADPGNAWVRSNLMQTYVTAGELAGRSGKLSKQMFFAKAAETARLTLADDPSDLQARAVLDRCAPKVNRR